MSKSNFILSDHHDNWLNLNPLTLTKPIAELRVGISTIKEKWIIALNHEVHVKTCIPYLKSKDNWTQQIGESYTFINASIIPDDNLVVSINKLKEGESLYRKGLSIASKIVLGNQSFEKEIQYEKELVSIQYPWDIFTKNDIVLRSDFKNITAGRISQKVSDTNLILGDEKLIFLEEGAVVEGAILNTQTGPIYLGKNAEIMEGSAVRGPLALCESASLKLSTKIYGATTIGPHSKVGGEVNNCVIQGFSNKGHDGFLGNSVIGEWCNIGADTNNSNLKNNYGMVSVYNYNVKDYMESNLQFLGLIMGDHSKCSINTMFNTGTVVGVFANIFGGDFPPKYIPSFSWGGSDGFTSYKIEKAIEVAEKVMERRSLNLTAEDKKILSHLYLKETNS
jgi:UDP-N-acetylglucosamine diphosphorylase/glucosamine-1-phosphate N-acetyltransferase